MTSTVKGPHVGAGLDLEDIAQPGAFQFQTLDYQPIEGVEALPDGTELRLAYCCPRTGQECGGIIIGKRVKPSRGCPTWRWDGEEFAPTLEPSINCQGAGCGWHGYLRKGEFQEC